MKSYKSIIILLFDLLFRLPKKFKYRSILSLLIMLLSSLAEVISLGLVLPFLLILISPDDVFNYGIIKFLATLTNFNDSSQLIFYISILFIISSLLAAFITYFS